MSSPMPLVTPSRESTGNRRNLKQSLFFHLRGDLTGGLSAALISLPMALGYGVLAVSSLGSEHASSGALLGLYSAVICGLLASILGGGSVQISGPAGSLTLVMTALVSGLVTQSALRGDGGAPWPFVLGMSSLCVLVGGLTQVGFGVMSLGRLGKCVPYPVLSGLMNGIGCLVIVSQVRPLLGVDGKTGFLEILHRPHLIRPAALLIGGAALAGAFLLKGRSGRLPASFLGLGLGALLFQAQRVIPGGQSGASPPLLPSLSPMDFHWPVPDSMLALSRYVGEQEFWHGLPMVLISGIALGLVGSVESLLSSAVASDLTCKAQDGDRELIGQGIANMAGSLFGALPSAGSVVRTAANFNGGGRSRLSGVLCSVFLLVGVGVLPSLMEAIPLAAIAGVMISIGLNLLDDRPLRLPRAMLSRGAHRREAFHDWLVILLVAGVTIAVNVVAAVLLGLAFTSFYLITKLGHTIVRREYSGNERRSRKLRRQPQEQILSEEGHRIRILELQGALFFASGEMVLKRIELAIADAEYCIVDLKHIHEMDSTGAQVLVRALSAQDQCGKRLLLSHLDESHPVWGSLPGRGEKLLPASFPDTDSALEWAEDRLLEESRMSPGACNEMTFEQTGVVEGLTSEEVEDLRRRLTLCSYPSGERVFGEGDPGRDLFILLRGRVTIRGQRSSRGHSRRLQTLCPGSVFGEMALLDGKARSADAWAEEDVDVLRLGYEAYSELARDNAGLFGKLTVNLARVSTGNLRRTDAEVRLLE